MIEEWVVRTEWVAYGQQRHRTTNPLTREQAEAYLVSLENDPKAAGKKTSIVKVPTYESNRTRKSYP